MLSSFSQSTTTDTSGQTAWILFGYLTREARNASLYLNYTVPDDFPKIDFEQFATDDVDLRGANGEDGLAFSQIGELILANKADIQQVTAVVHVFFNIIYIYIYILYLLLLLFRSFPHRCSSFV
jgi:hypothetical protein